MSDIKYFCEIEEIIQSTVKEVEMDIELKKDNSGINMSYNFIGDYIGVDLNRLVAAKDEMTLPIPLELYVKILTIHELGHAIDRQALMATMDRTVEIYHMKQNHSLKELYNNLDLLTVILEEHKMNITFEYTAWDNAEMLNEKYAIVEPGYLAFVKKHSLSTYLNSYHEDLSIYNNLIAEANEQIA